MYGVSVWGKGDGGEEGKGEKREKEAKRKHVQSVQDLHSKGMRIPTQMENALMIIHSYLVVKVLLISLMFFTRAVDRNAPAFLAYRFAYYYGIFVSHVLSHRARCGRAARMNHTVRVATGGTFYSAINQTRRERICGENADASGCKYLTLPQT